MVGKSSLLSSRPEGCDCMVVVVRRSGVVVVESGEVVVAEWCEG